MMESLANPSKAETQEFLKGNMTYISYGLNVSQVFLSASGEKLSLRDGGHLLKDIIQMDNLYPRLPEMKAALEGDYMDTLQEMLAKTKGNEEGMVYQQLFLCHPDSTIIQKWVLFINREKLDCNIDFNRENFGLNTT